MLNVLILIMEQQEPDAPASLVVLDVRGELFDRIRRLELGNALWRTLHTPARGDVLSEATVLLVAVYDQPDWSTTWDIAHRFPTLIAAHPASSADALRALQAGAFGYFDSEIPADALRRMLAGALRGESIYAREIVGAWLRDGQGSRRARANGAQRLTARQREIVALIARGATDKEIGTSLGIRTTTAQKHVANLLRRLGVPNRAAAVGLLWKDRTEDQSPA